MADMRASALVSCGGSMWDGDGDDIDIGGDGDDDDTASEPSQRRCVSQTRLKFTRAESTPKSKSRLSGDAMILYDTRVCVRDVMESTCPSASALQRGRHYDNPTGYPKQDPKPPNPKPLNPNP